MLLIHVLLFAIINFLIFHLLTGKIKLNLKIQITLVFSIILIIMIYYLSSFNNSISINHFNRLLFFSGTIFIFHFATKLLIKILQKVSNTKTNKLLISGFNFFKTYLVYILIFSIQCLSLFWQ
ncbi:hypothetical protein CJ739_891 [Mariniflexile rhizosphaerae]|nr:hypothetical protein CJ739_891 [Mariniflexile sp. TRM1-10]